MALLRYKEVTKMTEKDRETRLKELRTELVKANVTANKQTAKTKELKRAIARLLTFSNKAEEVKDK
jgi:ribosomal protein L29